MENEMTDAERLAMMRRINDRLLVEMERELKRPAWHPVAWALGAFACGIGTAVAAAWIAKHLL